MNLENEYFHWETLLTNARSKLAEFEALNVENMTEEQINAINRGIKRCKEDIEEAEELLEEIKEELIEFINNGGEVSETALKELQLDDETNETIEFEVCHKDSGVQITGYVYANEIDDEAPLHFYDQYGLECGNHVPTNPYPENTLGGYDNHIDYEIISTEFQSDDLFLQCLWDFKDENKTIDRGAYLLIINDGAKMECEIEKPSDYRGDWIVELIPKFNGERIYFAEFMEENGITFDPYGGCDEFFGIEDGHIYFEISKDYFEGDDEDREDNLQGFINPEAKSVFARFLVEEAKIGELFGDELEQCLEDETDDDWLFRFMTAIKEDSVKELIDAEGYEYPSE